MYQHPTNVGWDRKKSEKSWFDEYQKLVANPTKVGEAAVYVQASRPKIVAAELFRSS